MSVLWTVTLFLLSLVLVSQLSIESSMSMLSDGTERSPLTDIVSDHIEDTVVDAVMTAHCKFSVLGSHAYQP